MSLNVKTKGQIVGIVRTQRPGQLHVEAYPAWAAVADTAQNPLDRLDSTVSGWMSVAQAACDTGTPPESPGLPSPRKLLAAMCQRSPVESARGQGAKGRGDRGDPQLELNPPWRAAPQNCSSDHTDHTESPHSHTGRNPGPEGESAVSEVTRQGCGGAQQAPQRHSGCDSGVCAGVGWRGLQQVSSSLPWRLLNFPLPLPSPSCLHPPQCGLHTPLSELRKLGQLVGEIGASRSWVRIWFHAPWMFLVCALCLCVCVWVCVRTWVCMCVCARLSICVCVCIMLLHVCCVHGCECPYMCACMVCAVCICVNVNVHEYVHTCMLRVRGDRVTPGHSSVGRDPGAGAAPGRRVTLPAGFQGSCVSRARPSRQSLGLRVKRGARSEIVNHCFLAGCLPLLIQVAITHSEYLATN